MSQPRSGWRRLLSGLAVILIAGALVGAVAAYRYLGPYRGFGQEKFVEIEHGMSTRVMARTLQRDGVVRSSWAFLFVRLLHPAARLQAGEYRFAAAATPGDVFRKIERGEIFYEEITIPEGSNVFDIANLLRASDTVKADAFLSAAADPQSVRDLDAAAPSLDGFLFPSTYRVTHKTTAAQLCRQMTTEFRRQWAMLSSTKRASDLHRVLTLASLIEREAALPAERPVIAGVFENRLRLGMPLQCDPTTVYAALLEKRYSGVIHKSDLASTNPYNTYTHAGLPPGPICNPGAASLRAALDPAAHGFLYFVAKPGQPGEHHFSATLDEHEKAVMAYRRAASQ